MTITPQDRLAATIEQLQIKSEGERLALQQQFKAVVETLNPVNILKSAVTDIGEQPGLASAAVSTSMAVGAGVLSKKMIVGKSHNIFKKMLGSVVEFTVARGIANNSDVIVRKGIGLLKKITHHMSENNNDGQRENN